MAIEVGQRVTVCGYPARVLRIDGDQVGLAVDRSVCGRHGHRHCKCQHPLHRSPGLLTVAVGQLEPV